MNDKKILFIAPGKGVPFNEAWEKEIKEISEILSAKVLATGGIKGIYEKEGNYITLRHNPLLHGIYAILACLYARKFDFIFLECSPYTRYFSVLLRLLNPNKAVYRINSRAWIEQIDKSTYLQQQIVKFRLIVVPTVQCLIAMEKYVQKNKICLVYPGINIEKYEYRPVHAVKPFRILFASAPLKHHKYPQIFKWKGIDLLLDSFQVLSEQYEIELYIIWRDAYTSELQKMIKQRDLQQNVVVVNRNVNIMEYYEMCDLTIFPARSLEHTPEFPSSIMESLSVGRPVILTDIFVMSEIVKKQNCGKVCNPNKEDITEAVEWCLSEYNTIQKQCRRTAELYFNLKQNSKILIDYINVLSKDKVRSN